MKRRIVIGLVVYSVILSALVIATVVQIEDSTRQLEDLVNLHKVEIIRERLLVSLKRTQSDLYLRNTRFAGTMDAVVDHVRDLNKVSDSCFTCHHTQQVRQRLERLDAHIQSYEDGLSRVLTLRASQERTDREIEEAHQLGASIVGEVDEITTLANARLADRTRDVWGEIDRSKRLLYVLLAVMPLLALAFGVMLMRGVTKPVQALVTATRRIQAGDLTHRITGLRDEHGEVAASFNAMAHTLEQQWQRLQWTEQILVLGELAGGLAHEINNPLAGIMNVMQLFAEDPTLSPQHKEIVTEVSRQVLRIEGLVKNLLHFARPPRPALSRTDVNHVVEASLKLAQRHPLFKRTEQRVIEVTQHLDARLPNVEADAQQLEQVFLNLLLNAADAIKGSGTIALTTRFDPAEAQVRVVFEDTGVGLTPEALAKLFLPFFTTKPKGTGLGLATSKRLVELHGGTIHGENRAAGGATFTISLPLKANPPAMTPVPGPL